MAVITGAAQGIGAACAHVFAEQGAKLVVGDINEVGATAVVEGHRRARRLLRLARRADVGSRADCEALVEHAIAHFGRIDILVNNAGIVHAAEFLDLAEEDFDRVLRINLKGAFPVRPGRGAVHGPAAAAAGGRRGVIVNMSSVNAVLAIANQVPYTVSKGGLNQLTKVMALALAPHGIRVMGIGPGSIATELLQTAVLTNEAARAAHPVAHSAAAAWVSRTKSRASPLFLASDDASYLTGTTRVSRRRTAGAELRDVAGVHAASSVDPARRSAGCSLRSPPSNSPPRSTSW